MKKVLLGFLLVTVLFLISVLSATLTVNLASRGGEVTVPDLRGLEIVQAIEALEQLDLNLKINGKEFDDALPPGAIITHQPLAGNQVRRGRSIEAIISIGPSTIPVPELRGAFTLQAQSILLENGLRIGRVSTVVSERHPKETVVGQDPAPPASLAKNATVDLLLSAGPPAPLWVMPDFIGRPLAEVVLLAQEAALEIGQVETQDYPGFAPGTVIGQKPPLGTPVSQAAPIELTVVRGKEGPQRPRVRFSLLSFYVPEGFSTRRVKVAVENERGSYTALEESRPPGDRVQVLIEVEGKTRASVYIDDRLQDTKFF